MLNPENRNRLLLPAAAAGIGAGLLIRTAFDKSPLSDNGSFIFPTPSEDAFAAVLDVHRDSGINPVLDISDDLVIRALMSDKSIVNHTINPELQEQLAAAGGSRVFSTKQPGEKVDRAQTILDKHGFESSLVTVPVPGEAAESADTDVHLLVSEAFPNGVIGYRSPLLSMMLKDGPGSKPPKWDDNSTKSVL